MRLTNEKRKQLILNYNNGDGPDNMSLAAMYNVSVATIRSTLIKAGVYVTQRGAYSIQPKGAPIPTVSSIKRENLILKEALRKVAYWQLPPSGKCWDKEQKEEMSYTAAFGINGARDYMIQLAKKALNLCNE